MARASKGRALTFRTSKHPRRVISFRLFSRAYRWGHKGGVWLVKELTKVTLLQEVCYSQTLTPLLPVQFLFSCALPYDIVGKGSLVSHVLPP